MSTVLAMRRVDGRLAAARAVQPGPGRRSRKVLYETLRRLLLEAERLLTLCLYMRAAPRAATRSRAGRAARRRPAAPARGGAGYRADRHPRDATLADGDAAARVPLRASLATPSTGSCCSACTASE